MSNDPVFGGAPATPYDDGKSINAGPAVVNVQLSKSREF